MSSRRSGTPGPKRPGEIKHLSTHGAEDLDELWASKREGTRPKTAEERAKQSEDLIKKLQQSDRFAAAAAAREERQRRVEAKARTKLRQKEPGPRTTICKTTDDGTGDGNMLDRVPTLEFRERAKAASAKTAPALPKRRDKTPLKAVPLAKRPPLPLGVKRGVAGFKASELTASNGFPDSQLTPAESVDQEATGEALNGAEPPVRKVVFAVAEDAGGNVFKDGKARNWPPPSNDAPTNERSARRDTSTIENRQRRGLASERVAKEASKELMHRVSFQADNSTKHQVPKLHLSALEVSGDGKHKESIEAEKSNKRQIPKLHLSTLEVSGDGKHKESIEAEKSIKRQVPKLHLNTVEISKERKHKESVRVDVALKERKQNISLKTVQESNERKRRDSVGTDESRKEGRHKGSVDGVLKTHGRGFVEGERSSAAKPSSGKSSSKRNSSLNALRAEKSETSPLQHQPPSGGVESQDRLSSRKPLEASHDLRIRGLRVKRQDDEFSLPPVLMHETHSLPERVLMRGVSTTEKEEDTQRLQRSVSSKSTTDCRREALAAQLQFQLQ